MPLTTTYLNGRLALLEGLYGPERQAELEAVLRLYNRVLGPVTSVSLHRPEILDLSMYSSTCGHSPIGFLVRDLLVKPRGNETQPIPGGGKGGGIQQAFLGALGEMAERLLAVLHFQACLDQIVYASYEDLVHQGRRALGPEELPLFAAEQYADPRLGYVAFRPDLPLGWIEGSDLLTGEAILLPAQLMLMYYTPRPGEPSIGYATSGGLAFHSDRRRAILHGLYEFIERDAINLRWYCRLAPPRVEVDLVSVLARHLGLRQPRMSTPVVDGVRIYLNTVDVSIPVLTAIAVDSSRREHAFLGGGGAWSRRERALTQALFEVGQSRNALKVYQPTATKQIRADSAALEMTDFFDAAIYYGYAENLPRLSWYMAGEKVLPWETVTTFHFSDEAEEYEVMLDWLAAMGLTPIVLDFSGACWPGVSVTKVFIPQLTQACIPSHPYLGHTRYSDLPQRLGLVDRRLEFRDLNSDPVPFS